MDPWFLIDIFIMKNLEELVYIYYTYLYLFWKILFHETESDHQGKTNLIVCNILDHFGSCFIIIICFNPPNFSVKQGYSKFCLKRIK